MIKNPLRKAVPLSRSAAARVSCNGTMRDAEALCRRVHTALDADGITADEFEKWRTSLYDFLQLIFT